MTQQGPGLMLRFCQLQVGPRAQKRCCRRLADRACHWRQELLRPVSENARLSPLSSLLPKWGRPQSRTKLSLLLLEEKTG